MLYHELTLINAVIDQLLGPTDSATGSKQLQSQGEVRVSVVKESAVDVISH